MARTIAPQLQAVGALLGQQPPQLPRHPVRRARRLVALGKLWDRNIVEGLSCWVAGPTCKLFTISITDLQDCTNRIMGNERRHFDEHPVVCMPQER